MLAKVLSQGIIRQIYFQQARVLANQHHKQFGNRFCNSTRSQIQLLDGHDLKCVEDGRSSVTLNGIQAKHQFLEGNMPQGATKNVSPFFTWKMNTS